MNEIVLAAIAFSTALAVHVCVWRRRPPANHTAGLLALFAANLFVLSLLAYLFKDGAGMSVSRWEMLRAMMLYVPASLFYVVCYSAIEHDSPTLTLVGMLHAAGGRGLDRAEIERLAAETAPVSSRAQALIDSGWVTVDGQGMALTPRGERLARMFLAFERLARLPRGG